jgi:hypothetical protein
MVHAAIVIERLIRDLRIFGGSLSPNMLQNLEAILGGPEDWDTEAHSLSEIAHFKELIDERRAALALSALTSPAGMWRAIRLVDRLRARFLPIPFFSERPCSIRQHAPDRFPREAWFFVNGIATDKELLLLNGRYLAKLFRRPVELIYNPTEGPFSDLLECVLGRTFDFVSSPAEYALERLSIALSNPEKERVVLIGHSQGGIIVSNVVAGLIERFGGDRTRLGKLEVYTFAAACDHVRTDPELDTPTRHVPFVEHFANTGDLVARLGVLQGELPIEGRVYTRDKPGHFLNTHYLREIERQQAYTWHDEHGTPHRDARLYQYLDGGTPELLPVETRPHPKGIGDKASEVIDSAQLVPGLA